jgi:hypothetical protein
MKIIHKMIESLEEEVEGAKEYAEQYIECKAKGNLQRANVFKEMAHDELRHATTLHDLYVKDIESIEKVYPIPDEVSTHWEHSRKRTVESIALIKQMLN